MTVLHLDYQPDTPFPWLGIVLLVAALCALTVTGAYYKKYSGQLAVWEAKAERANDRRAAGRASARGEVNLAQEVKNANDVLRHLGVPWESLFQALESSGNRNINLLALEPDIEKQQVKISGEAKNFNELMKYITYLQGQTVIGSVYLQNHDVQKQHPDRPVRFSLLAAWRDRT